MSEKDLLVTMSGLEIAINKASQELAHTDMRFAEIERLMGKIIEEKDQEIERLKESKNFEELKKRHD